MYVRCGIQYTCVFGFFSYFGLDKFVGKWKKPVSMPPKKSTKKSASLEQGAKGETLEKTKEQTNLQESVKKSPALGKTAREKALGKVKKKHSQKEKQ